MTGPSRERPAPGSGLVGAGRGGAGVGTLEAGLRRARRRARGCAGRRLHAPPCAARPRWRGTRRRPTPPATPEHRPVEAPRSGRESGAARESAAGRPGRDVGLWASFPLTTARVLPWPALARGERPRNKPAPAAPVHARGGGSRPSRRRPGPLRGPGSPPVPPRVHARPLGVFALGP